MGWLIALAVIVLLALLPLGVWFRYDEVGVALKVIAGPVHIGILPAKKKKEKPKKEKQPKKKPETTQKSATAPEVKKSGGPVTDFLPLIQLVFDLLGDFFHKLRFERLELDLTMAGDDPCDLAVNYGRTQALVCALEPAMTQILDVKKKDVRVRVDFEHTQTLIYVCGQITITLGALIVLLVRYGVLAVREYLKIMKLRKGGASL